MHALLIIVIAEIQQNGYLICFNSKEVKPGVTRAWILVNKSDFNTVSLLTSHKGFFPLRRHNIQIVAANTAESIKYILCFHQSIVYYYKEGTRKAEKCLHKFHKKRIKKIMGRKISELNQKSHDS